MIVNGRNLYPQDIEEFVQDVHPAVAGSRGCVVPVDVDDAERLVLIQAVKTELLGDTSCDELAAAVKSAVARAFEVPAPSVVFVNRAGIHLTTSGKVQRASMRAAFLNGELTDVVHEEHPADERDIAIVGLDCRFPQADDPAALWKLLLDGADGIDEIPAERWNAAELAPTTDAVNHLAGGLISDADAFDNEFFGITPREAEAMDPQQRLLLQTAWRALENATLDPRGQAGSNTGVFVGVMANEWAHLHMSDYARDHRAARFGQRLLHDRQPALLPPRPQGPEPRRRHRVLVVAGRGASGRAGAAQRRNATRRSPPASTSP